MFRYRFQWRVLLMGLLAALTITATGWAEDWPTYRHDNRRSGVTPERLDVAALQEKWVYRSPLPPQPAWHGPAKWDAFSGTMDLRSMRNFDPVFYTIVVGESLYFGSTAEDAVFRLNAEDGAIVWTKTVGGAVRIAPAFADAKLYFGADDSFAYCLRADDGEEVWRHSPAPNADRIPSNGKLVSRWPCRTGVLLADSKAYFATALLPWREAFLCAVDAQSGKPEGDGCFTKELTGVTMEGALLASNTKLYVPQGRSAPMVFNRATGDHLGNVESGGGVFALLTPDNKIVLGPSDQKEFFVALNDPESGDKVASFDRGNFMIVTEDRAYVLKDEELLAVERPGGEALWSVASDSPFTLILAGDVLLAGGKDKVTAHAVADGAVLATFPVDGRAYGITAANGALYVSTGTGAIHCFR